MTHSQKKLLMNLGLGFGVLVGFMLTMFMFMPSKDLDDYKRLTGGAGTVVPAVSQGGVASTQSGRKATASKTYCTSWKYQVDGADRYFTDKSDCYNEQSQAKSGTSGELIYDPAAPGIIFVRSGDTLKRLENQGNTFRIMSVVGVIILAGSIAGLVAVNRRKPAKAKASE